MNRKALTDRTVNALRATGRRYEVADALVPGMAVRVTEKGERSFVLISRYPGSPNPTRRCLGRYGAITLDAARDKARAWIALIKRGIDPRAEEERLSKAAVATARNTFAAVAEDFIARHLKGQRKAKVVERTIRNELINKWGERPITAITRGDVQCLIEKIVDRPARTYAHNVYDAARALFAWATDRYDERGDNAYGLAASPCDGLKRKRLIGSKEPRLRVLSDDELRALWSATDQIGYPFGPMIRALMLTGARLDEVAGARWREFDWPRRLWSVPAERYKSKAEHIVPLSNDAVALFDNLPRWSNGDYLFSTRVGRKPDDTKASKRARKKPDGKKPVNGFSKAKARIDAHIGEVPHWVLHDIRRTVRTRLSALRIPDPIAEMVIGHAKKGLARVYDQHKYVDEMREALEAWSACLRRIVRPPDNVVEFPKAAVTSG